MVSPGLLARCPAPPPAVDGTVGALLQNHVETMRDFRACASLHDSLVSAIRGQDGIVIGDDAAAGR